MSIGFYCEMGPLLRNVKPVGFVFELEAIVDIVMLGLPIHINH